jgi:hypothetical protein
MAGVQCCVQLLVLQTKEDEELTGALDSLDMSLKENIQLLSSFEKYKKEVLGDSLDWTPMHTSQQVTPLILALILLSFHPSTATSFADLLGCICMEKS